MAPPRSLVWFRRDLRLADNPAWAAAQGPTTALYVLDPALFDRAGPFRRRQLLAHLAELDAQLAEHGGRLRIERGAPAEVVARVVSEVGATAVHANADVTPYSRRRDTATHRTLARLGVPLDTSWGTLVHHPGAVLTAKGTLPLVFTPFFTRWSETAWHPWPDGDGPRDIAAEPGVGVPPVDGQPPMPGGELAAIDRLVDFGNRVDDYPETRDRPAINGTSALSADLRFGTVSPRRVAMAIGSAERSRAAFVRQLAWRDWYAHLLMDRPDLATTCMNPAFELIEWRDDPVALEAWQQGRTGYPIVDAGMRQLATTGWMHNRVRMVAASFLVKDLLIDWRRGERWFRHLLVDGDVSQNVGNWQWVAGTGPDSAPYFRVFNPVLQSRKFDPDGDYIRRFVPELARVPNRWIHAPSDAPAGVLADVGVALGEHYPEAIVDHAMARDRALATYAAARSQGTAPPSGPG